MKFPTVLVFLLGAVVASEANAGLKGTRILTPTSINQIDIGSIRPEGVTAGPGSIMYTSEIYFGGVKTVDVVTGEVTQLVPSAGIFQRFSLGLWYAQETIFVAGGGTVVGVPPSLHVYSANDGTEIVTCNPAEGGFLNDLIVDNGFLYVTDSITPNVFAYKVADLLVGNCDDYSVIPLPESFSGEGFYANGIEVYKQGLIVANVGGGGFSTTQEFWYIDLESGKGTLLFPNAGDGLLVDGDILYSVEPLFNKVAVYELEYEAQEGVKMKLLPNATITSDLFRAPTTVAMYKGTLFLPNSLLDQPNPAEGEADPATFEEVFDLIGVPAYE